MWLCRHSSACSPGGMGGEVHASVHYWVAGPGHDIEGTGRNKMSRLAIAGCEPRGCISLHSHIDKGGFDVV